MLRKPPGFFAATALLLLVFSTSRKAYPQVIEKGMESIEKDQAPRIKKLANDLVTWIKGDAKDDAHGTAKSDTARLDTSKPFPEAELTRAEDEKLDSEVSEHIRKCAVQVFVRTPVKKAAKTALRASIAEYARPGSTGDSVLNVAYGAFSADAKKEIKSTWGMSDATMNDMLQCVVSKAVKDPISRASMGCAIQGMAKPQTDMMACFIDHLLQQ
jgi:hypothetical protein